MNEERERQYLKAKKHDKLNIFALLYFILSVQEKRLGKKWTVHDKVLMQDSVTNQYDAPLEIRVLSTHHCVINNHFVPEPLICIFELANHQLISATKIFSMKFSIGET